MEVIMFVSGSCSVGDGSGKVTDFASGFETYNRELYNSMVAGNGEFLSSQRWQLAFCRLQEFSTLFAISTSCSAEYHITRVTIYKFEEVRVILVTVFRSSSCVTLVHLQQHQSIVLLLHKEPREELIVAGEIGEGSLNWQWHDSFLATQYVLPLCCMAFISILYHETKLREILVGYVEKLVSFVGSICTDQSLDSWTTYKLQLYIQVFSALKQLLNPAPSDESPQDTRHCGAGMSQEFSIFTSFDSSFGYRAENIVHMCEGKLIMLLPFEGNKQHCPFLITNGRASVYTVGSRITIYHILVHYTIWPDLRHIDFWVRDMYICL